MPDKSPLTPDLFQFTTEELAMGTPEMIRVLYPSHISPPEHILTLLGGSSGGPSAGGDGSAGEGSSGAGGDDHTAANGAGVSAGTTYDDIPPTSV